MLFYRALYYDCRALFTVENSTVMVYSPLLLFSATWLRPVWRWYSQHCGRCVVGGDFQCAAPEKRIEKNNIQQVLRVISLCWRGERVRRRGYGYQDVRLCNA